MSINTCSCKYPAVDTFKFDSRYSKGNKLCPCETEHYTVSTRRDGVRVRAGAARSLFESYDLAVMHVVDTIFIISVSNS